MCDFVSDHTLTGADDSNTHVRGWFVSDCAPTSVERPGMRALDTLLHGIAHCLVLENDALQVSVDNAVA